jgi:hypothetical protein
VTNLVGLVKPGGWIELVELDVDEPKGCGGRRCARFHPAVEGDLHTGWNGWEFCAEAAGVVGGGGPERLWRSALWIVWLG